ncbi:MAG: hypothetical protein ACE361_21300 [Aureliella sp.]
MTANESQDLLIGVANHQTWSDFCGWFRSARKSGFIGKVVLILYEDTPESTIRRCISEGIEVVRLKLSGSVNQQRWNDISVYLREQSKVERVITTDVRDVVFQTSIHEMLDATLVESELSLFCEGWTYEHSEFNRNEMQQSFPLSYSGMAEHEVICCGVVVGSKAAMVQLADDIGERCAKAKTQIGDQATVNILIRERISRGEQIALFGTEDPYCCHFGVTAPENMKNFQEHGMRPAPLFSRAGGLATTPDGEAYCVFHQYTKVPSIRRQVLRKVGCLGEFYFGKGIEALRRRLPWTRKAIPYWMRPEITAPRS